VNSEINDIIKNLIAKSLAGESNAIEETQLDNWIASDPENERQFDLYKKSLSATETYLNTASKGKTEHIDIDAEWGQFTATISKGKTRKLNADEAGENKWWRMAAAVLILVTSGLLINYLLTKEEDLQFASADTTKVITLPDGSSVTMNRHSRLTCSENFGTTDRTVQFSGEGFFNVTTDSLKPFIIEVASGRVEVIGTSFNVLAYDSLEQTEVTVKTGIVRFSIPGIRKVVKLVAGQKGVFEKTANELTSIANDNVNYLSWNTHEMTFNETDLRSVIETVNKTYNTNIVISTEISDSCVVTVKFDRQTLDAVLRVLENTLNLSFRKTGNNIEIIGAGC
jgi:ferric-dicitrate binding protein FerR (iron transport regulator)